jgi:predicted secreted hydrolase
MKKAFVCVFLSLILFCYAEASSEKDQLKTIKKAKSQVVSKQKALSNDSSLHPLAERESWYISGLVDNDAGEQYGYYFAVLRESEVFYVFANVMNLKTGKIVFSEEQKADIKIGERLGINLKIKDAFLRFNDINDSWVFGLDKPLGFNLRLESLSYDAYSVSHLDRVSFYSLQSKRVNGQLTIEGKNQFVTAKNAWLTHEWSDKLTQSLVIQRLMCRLFDGRGLMLMRGYKEKKVAFDLALLLEANGKSAPISQFSVVSQANPLLWEVSLLSPKMQFNIETAPPQKMSRRGETSSFYSGVVRSKEQKIEGYCFISKDAVGSGSQNKPTDKSKQTKEAAPK